MVKKILPKTTVPNTKFIRTLEGVALIVFHIVIILAATIDTLSLAQGAKWLAIVDSVALLARSGLKMVLAATGKPDPLAQPAIDAQTLATQVAQQIQAGKPDLSLVGPLERLVDEIRGHVPGLHHAETAPPAPATMEGDHASTLEANYQGQPDHAPAHALDPLPVGEPLRQDDPADTTGEPPAAPAESTPPAPPAGGAQ